ERVARAELAQVVEVIERVLLPAVVGAGLLRGLLGGILVEGLGAGRGLQAVRRRRARGEAEERGKADGGERLGVHRSSPCLGDQNRTKSWLAKTARMVFLRFWPFFWKSSTYLASTEGGTVARSVTMSSLEKAKL